MSSCMRLDRERKNRAFASSLFVTRVSFDTNKIGSNLFPTLRVGLDAKKG